MSTRRDFLNLTVTATAVGALASSASAQAPAAGPGCPIPPAGGCVASRHVRSGQ